jgi:hypothetical protein
MGGVAEREVTPHPSVHVVGPFAGTPLGEQVLAQQQGRIWHAIAALRQHYLTGTAPSLRKRLSFPGVHMEYLMQDGHEMIQLEPFGTTPSSDVPSGPCRWIIVEHTYAQNREVLAQRSPDYIPPFSPDPDLDYMWSQTDGHSLVARHEVVAGPLAGKFVGTTTGPSIQGGTDWTVYRFAPDSYTGFRQDFMLFDPYETWPFMWRYWRNRPIFSALPTKGSTLRPFVFDGIFPPSVAYVGQIWSAESTNIITVVDVKQFLKTGGELLKLECSGYWGALQVEYAPALSGVYEASKFWFEAARAFVGIPTPYPIITSVTRVWAPEHADGASPETISISQILQPPLNSEFFPVYTPEYVAGLDVVMATTSYEQIVTARANGISDLYPNFDGSPARPDVGYPPTVLPWGQSLGTLVYNCRTGENSFRVPDGVRQPL